MRVQTSGPGLATPLPQALAAQRKAANPRERAGEQAWEEMLSTPDPARSEHAHATQAGALGSSSQ